MLIERLCLTTIRHGTGSNIQANIHLFSCCTQHAVQEDVASIRYRAVARVGRGRYRALYNQYSGHLVRHPGLFQRRLAPCGRYNRVCHCLLPVSGMN